MLFLLTLLTSLTSSPCSRYYRVFQIIDSGNENRTKTLSEGNSLPSTTKTIATPPASKRLSATTPRVADLTKAASSIYIENVSFYYKHRPDVLVLKNVSLTIQKNQITCIAGKSGAGKSTLAAILCGLHHPTSGVISYGKNIEIVGEADRGSYNEDKEMLHNLFGVVEQSSSTLFTGTIVDNIAYGKVSTTAALMCLYCNICSWSSSTHLRKRLKPRLNPPMPTTSSRLSLTAIRHRSDRAGAFCLEGREHASPSLELWLNNPSTSYSTNPQPHWTRRARKNSSRPLKGMTEDSLSL